MIFHRLTNYFCLYQSRRSRKVRPLHAGLMMAALALCLCFASAARAQSFQAGIDFSTVIPVGEFRDNVSNNGYGIGGQFLFAVGRSPIFIGADVGFVTYGSETRREPLSPTIPEIELRVRTTNNIALTHLLVRAQPRYGAVRPYVDGLIGFKYLYTQTAIRDEFDGEDLATTTNQSDLTFSYGFGGGVQWRLADLGGGRDISLDTKARYLRGSEAEYLKKGSIRRGAGGVFFDVLESRTDTISLQIGVTLRF